MSCDQQHPLAVAIARQKRQDARRTLGAEYARERRERNWFAEHVLLFARLQYVRSNVYRGCQLLEKAISLRFVGGKR